MDRVDIALTDFELIENDYREADVPIYVGDIVHVELIGGSNRPLPLMDADVYTKDNPRIRSGSPPLWWRGRWSNGGKIAVSGNLSGSSVRLWFIRRPPPLHFGRTTSTSDAELILDTSGETVLATQRGRVSRVPGDYVGQLVYVDGDSAVAGGGANVGQLRRVTAFDASTVTCTFESVLPAALTATTDYSFVIPLEYPAFDYMVKKVVHELAIRLGNAQYTAITERAEMLAEERFDRAIGNRDRGHIHRVWNTRGRR